MWLMPYLSIAIRSIPIPKARARAIAIESARENFLTKHANIIYQGSGTESFVDINDVLQCKVSHIDWQDRDVYIGVDLAMTNDNCAVSIVAEEDGIIMTYNHLNVHIVENLTK